MGSASATGYVRETSPILPRKYLFTAVSLPATQLAGRTAKARPPVLLRAGGVVERGALSLLFSRAQSAACLVRSLLASLSRQRSDSALLLLLPVRLPRDAALVGSARARGRASAIPHISFLVRSQASPPDHGSRHAHQGAERHHRQFETPASAEHEQPAVRGGVGWASAMRPRQRTRPVSGRTSPATRDRPTSRAPVWRINPATGCRFAIPTSRAPEAE